VVTKDGCMFVQEFIVDMDEIKQKHFCANKSIVSHKMASLELRGFALPLPPLHGSTDKYDTFE
jgi:hypothetical protein